MDFSKMDIAALNKEEERAEAKYNAIQDDCVKKGLSFEEFQKLVKDEAEKLYFIGKYKRLLQDPIVEFGKEWKGDLYTLEEFKKMARDGSIVDDDGYGYYATELGKSDVMIYPSDITENLIREDFTHVIWFNR